MTARTGGTTPPVGNGDVEVVVLGADLGAVRAPLCTLWVEVTQAGGAIGFRPPVTVTDVAPTVDRLLDAAAAGRSRLVAALQGSQRQLVGLVAVSRDEGPRYEHRVTLERLQVHPLLQGRGLGARLVSVAHGVAVEEFGSELALVAVRAGLGLEHFYLRLGYAECARIPNGLAFEDGARFDEHWLVYRLDAAGHGRSGASTTP